jgi:hypothetical protein
LGKYRRGKEMEKGSWEDREQRETSEMGNGINN